MATMTDALALRHDPQVGESLQQGYTLPAAWYTRDDVYALEQERIFRRCWQYVGYAEQLATPGDIIQRLVHGVLSA
jgi:choline monooxygenase